jgi:hypothetical protein
MLGHDGINEREFVNKLSAFCFDTLEARPWPAKTKAPAVAGQRLI